MLLFTVMLCFLTFTAVVEIELAYNSLAADLGYSKCESEKD